MGGELAVGGALAAGGVPDFWVAGADDADDELLEVGELQGNWKVSCPH